MKVLVTGAAGFIGYHAVRRLLDDGHQVVGYDALTDYYDPGLKDARLRLLREDSSFSFVRGELEDESAIRATFVEYAPEVVLHLAAQAGVRYSIDHPRTYIESNLIGTWQLLEAVRASPVKHLMFASTSSVYGGNVERPSAEVHTTDAPQSLYAATKRGGEAMVHSYAHLFDIPSTVFRFFTVYGPWGRPDMALFKFVRAILDGDEIDVYGEGKLSRDFTYVDDLVDSIIKLMPLAPVEGARLSPHDSLSPVAPYRVVNIAAGRPIGLMGFIAAIENSLGLQARLNMLPMQPGDVKDTAANASLLMDMIGSLPSTPLEHGVQAFVEWYVDYYGVER